jgi:tetratricopeptide (TPR) repeat protein
MPPLVQSPRQGTVSTISSSLSSPSPPSSPDGSSLSKRPDLTTTTTSSATINHNRTRTRNNHKKLPLGGPPRPPPSPRTLANRKRAATLVPAAAAAAAPESPESVHSRVSTSSARSSKSSADDDDLQALEQALAETMRRYGTYHGSVGAVCNRLGNWYFRHQRYDSAVNMYQRAVVCTAGRSSRPSSRSNVGADALSNLGTVYWTTGDLSQARSVLKQALAAYSMDLVAVSAQNSGTSPNTILLATANVHHQLGLVYSLEENFVQALECLEEARKIRQQAARPDLVAKTLDAMGQVCCLQKDYTAALQYYASALALPSTQKTLTLENMAWIYGQRGDAPGALAVFHDLLQERRSLYTKTPSPEGAMQLAKVYAVMISLYDAVSRPVDAQRMQHNLNQLIKDEGIQPPE